MMNSKINIETFVTKGLGDNSFLISYNDEAAVIDPQRDAWRFLKKADSIGVGIKYIMETHVHNDYISGALEIKDVTGSDILVPKKGGYKFSHKSMIEGNSVKLGDLTITAWETPGHTYEHMSWLVSDDNGPQAIFTGGSLIVGSSGRTDLFGDDHTDILTRHQFDSVQRIATLPDYVGLLPTHGGGSFCTAANVSSNRVSKLKDEKLFNEALKYKTADEFVDNMLLGLRKYPSYYKYIAPQNREGVEVVGSIKLPPKLSESEFNQFIEDGNLFIDTRNRKEYAEGYIEGSFNVELTPSFGTYLGWVFPYNHPLILLVKFEADLIEAVTQLFRIGISKVNGYVLMDQPYIKSRTQKSFNLVAYSDLINRMENGDDYVIVDVRDPLEVERDGAIQSSKKLFIGDIPSQLEALRNEYGEKQLITICVSGERAVVSAGIMRQYGLNATSLFDGGVPNILNHIKTKDHAKKLL